MLGNGSALSWLAAGGLLISGVVAVACSAKPPEKTPLVVCEAGEKGCPKEKSADRNKGGDDDDDDDSSGSSLTKGSDDPSKAPPTTIRDAGSDRIDPTGGPRCGALRTCCSALRTAGINGSAGQCDRTVTAGDEATCSRELETYKTPDDYYDPVCF